MVSLQKMTQNGNTIEVSGKGDSVRVTINGKTYTNDGPVDDKIKENRHVGVVESLTFLFYTMFVLSFIGGGTAYLIFWKGISPWYGLIGLIALEEFLFTPKQWATMFNQKG